MNNIRLQYYWNTGSIPPPDYYEYTIEVTADGGLIHFRPDYPENKPVEWQESFSLKKEQFNLMVQTAESIPAIEEGTEISVGGSAEKLILFSGIEKSKQLSISSAKGRSLVEKIKMNVPEKIWMKLMKSFDTYRDARIN